MIKETLIYNVSIGEIPNDDLPPDNYHFVTTEKSKNYGVEVFDVYQMIKDCTFPVICEIDSREDAIICAKALNNPSCVEGL